MTDEKSDKPKKLGRAPASRINITKTMHEASRRAKKAAGLERKIRRIHEDWEMGVGNKPPKKDK